MMSSTAKILKELRKTKGVTMQQLADITDISKSTINNYERGIAAPRMDKAKILAEYFDVLPEYILGLTTIKNRDEERKESSRAVDENKDFASQSWITDTIDDLPRDFHEINTIYRTLNSENKTKVNKYASDLQRLQEFETKLDEK